MLLLLYFFSQGKLRENVKINIFGVNLMFSVFDLNFDGEDSFFYSSRRKKNKIFKRIFPNDIYSKNILFSCDFNFNN